MDGVGAEMPRYKCHKEVHALKIAILQAATGDHASGQNEETDGGFLMYAEQPGYAPIKLDANWVRKHEPEAGGYYVVYEDGYASFSPAKAFEAGYTLID